VFYLVADDPLHLRLDVFALAQRWRWLLYLLPLLLVSWVPYLVLRQGRRYKAAEARAQEQEQARPHYVLSVVSTEQRGLAGGFLRA
jgi:hypothetical protein